jgi:hypothetical protein
MSLLMKWLIDNGFKKPKGNEMADIVREDEIDMMELEQRKDGHDVKKVLAVLKRLPLDMRKRTSATNVADVLSVLNPVVWVQTKDRPPPPDSLVIKRWKESGTMMLGRYYGSVTPELLFDEWYLVLEPNREMPKL